MKAMKALVKKLPQKGIWREEVPIPDIGVNDVLVKIKKTSICGTDLHIYKWDQWSQRTIKTPMSIGHEYVGTIVDMGNGVKNLHIGDRITSEGILPAATAGIAGEGKNTSVKISSAPG
jgi:threonine 3-dehydrogenase